MTGSVPRLDVLDRTVLVTMWTERLVDSGIRFKAERGMAIVTGAAARNLGCRKESIRFYVVT